MDIDTLLLPADKPDWIYFFGRFSGMKKAALEKFIPKCDIFFFFFLFRTCYSQGRVKPRL
jgi:hypothetical protein